MEKKNILELGLRFIYFRYEIPTCSQKYEYIYERVMKMEYFLSKEGVRIALPDPLWISPGISLLMLQ